MKNLLNIKDLVELTPDFIGFIFYRNSKRYVGEDFDSDILNLIPPKIKKVGVFVDLPIKELLEIYNKYNLDFVQLHGSESVMYCKNLYEQNIKVIKAFGIKPDFDFYTIFQYEKYCRYFLFDTFTPEHGGSGKLFDWSILDNYNGDTPFLLSGGVHINQTQEIKKISHPRLAGVDINSKFETEPAFKDIPLISNFIQSLKS